MEKNLCTQAGGKRATYPFIFSTPSFFFVPHPLARKNGQTGAVLYLRHLHIPPFQTALPLCSASLNSTGTPNFSFLRRHCTLHTSRYRRLLLVNSLCQNLARLEGREEKEKEKNEPLSEYSGVSKE